MVKITIAGDFVPQNRVNPLFQNNQFSQVLSEVVPITQESDYSIVNLEAPVVKGTYDPIPKCGPNLKTEPYALSAIKWAGFDCVTLANNHALDYGEKGLIDTMEGCHENNIDHIGAGRSLNEATRTLYKVIGGKTFAFINCCEYEYSIATDHSAGCNPINPLHQFYAIRDAKASGADYIIVICHGGIEQFQYPTPRMVEWYRFFIDAGADVVINHHQHCFSGYERYKGKLIFYGLGNFCFDRPTERNSIWNEGLIVELLFDSKIDFKIYPYRQCDSLPHINILEGEGRQEIMKRVEEISTSIVTGDYINKFNEFLSKHCNFDWVFTPYQNSFAKRLFNHKLLPKILGQRSWKELRSLLLCESHFERFRYFVMSKQNEE